ncbi:hypothetical protein Q31b_03950 [Novipirellula aureliae]|uniref:DUF2760 domain-containing protein n=1 Tax=Novipirellula aureliae TaxID=2527966 RepID=A0A5C6E9C2_9BACT|nr:DUF2760 domain-containing protein [Novipirellula aureliae]TWU45224.1 hypothetical protein Q31b_03950 [Novipirellula aureliae]
MGLGIALRAFSAALFNKQAADKIRKALDQEITQAEEPKLPAPAPKPVESPKPATSVRSDAVTLLSALQREARLIDLVQEDLANFSDAQVGAAARPCLTQCASTLARLFELKPVDDSGEGSLVQVDAENSIARYQWLGEGGQSEQTSTAGKLVHQGWQATKVELPRWTGRDADATIIAPAQVQRSNG